uniref:Integrase catalytic domain-containing protein n=1 Tax=Xenopus tropicalis TaxID=8364 RepID=A0A803JAA2_XENTR
MIPHSVPSRPWQKVASDLFVLDNVNYILVVDYYSRFFELECLKNTSSSNVIEKLKAIFARHGIPDEFVSDNGTQFASAEFTKAYDFQHTTSSPNYPQSNGQIEKTVQTVKHLLSKAKQSGGDPYIAILEYRNTPIDGIGSPAQLLMSRRLRSTLPMTHKQLLPQIIPSALMRTRLQNKQQRQSRYYNRGARPLSVLQEGDQVMMQKPGGKWQPGHVTSKLQTPRSYLVETDDGGVYRRNHRHLIKKRAPLSTNSLDDDLEESESTPMKQPELQHSSQVPSSESSNTDAGASPQNRNIKTTRCGRMVKPPQRLNL